MECSRGIKIAGMLLAVAQKLSLYFCTQVSEALAGKVHDIFHLPDVQGSDHCPIGLVLHAN